MNNLVLTWNTRKHELDLKEVNEDNTIIFVKNDERLCDIVKLYSFSIESTSTSTVLVKVSSSNKQPKWSMMVDAIIALRSKDNKFVDFCIYPDSVMYGDRFLLNPKGGYRLYDVFKLLKQNYTKTDDGRGIFNDRQYVENLLNTKIVLPYADGQCDRKWPEEEKQTLNDKRKAAGLDPINPSYYGEKGMQPNDFIDAQDLTYNKGQAVKYIARAGKKYEDKHVEDLKKARYYIDREISRLEKMEAEIDAYNKTVDESE